MQMRSAPSVLGLILFYHYIILHELIYAPWNFFRGSLIPRQPFVGGRNATQSASRGDLDVQCRTDYLVANRLVWLDIVLPSKFLQRHAQQSSDKRERRCKTKQLYPNQTTYPRSLFRDIFHWREVNPIDDLSLLYRKPKARIWLKLSPPIFFQLFIWKRFTLVFLPYI